MLGKLFGKSLTQEESRIKAWCKKHLGLVPRDFTFYRRALTHSSALSDTSRKVSVGNSNERLEFLGDAVLASVVATILFKKYPDKGEGFLTRFRARLVQRHTLNKLADDVELHQVLRMRTNGGKESSIKGNALEAVIGAIYLDLGYRAAEKAIIKMINDHVDFERLARTESDKKSRLLEWCQKHRKKVRFKVDEESEQGKGRNFKAEVYIDGVSKGYGTGSSKKKAEQEASKYALRKVQQRGRRRKKATS